MAYDPLANVKTVLQGYVRDARTIEDMLFIKGKVAVVTGGTSGLGFDIALRLLQGGATVILAGSNEAKGQLAVSLLEEQGFAGKVLFKKTDITSEEDMKALVEFADEKCHSLDIYVNSAAVWSYGHVYDLPEAEFERVLRTNTIGLFLGIKHVSRYMIDRKIKGKITAISSNSAVMPYPIFGGYPHYASSKGAVNSMVIETAKELKRFDISVNAVMPGGMGTPGATTTLAADGMTEEAEDTIYEEIAATASNCGLQTVDGVAMTAYMLCTAVADEITGECILADNGMSHNICRVQVEAEKYPYDED